MKKILATTLLALTLSAPAFAGNIEMPPVVEPPPPPGASAEAQVLDADFLYVLIHTLQVIL